MSPLVKSLLKKKARSQKTGGRNLNDLAEKIGRIIAENRRGLASGKLGSQAWWRELEQLTMHKDKSSSSLDQQFINGLNDYIGGLCLDRN